MVHYSHWLHVGQLTVHPELVGKPTQESSSEKKLDGEPPVQNTGLYFEV